MVEYQKGKGRTMNWKLVIDEVEKHNWSCHNPDSILFTAY